MFWVVSVAPTSGFLIQVFFQLTSQGFYELIPQHLLKPFDERELELVIGGLGKIDINDWKKHTRLKHCSQDSNIVKWFWMAVESFDEEKRARYAMVKGEKLFDSC